MKLSYKIPGGSYTVLFDESAGATLLAEFTPGFKSITQQEPLAGSTNQFRTARSNLTVDHPLMFNQEYASRALSLASVRTFAALLNTKVHLKVEQDAEVQYYPNAIAASYQPRLMGVSADHALQFTSDTVTTVDPT